MVFSDTSGKQGLIQDVTFLLGLGLTAYTIEDRTRNMNSRFSMLWHTIFESYGGWKYIDDNTSDTSTGVPYADQTINSGTSLYQLPSAALAINGIQVKSSAGVFQTPLSPLTEEQFLQMGGEAAFPSTGTPWAYLLQGDILRLLPTPNYTLASAIRVFFDQGISTFATSDTTKVPGFASPFHRALSVGCALDYAMARGMQDKKVWLEALWNDYEKRIADFYSKRYKARYPHRIQAGVDLVQEFS